MSYPKELFQSVTYKSRERTQTAHSTQLSVAACSPIANPRSYTVDLVESLGHSRGAES